MTTASATLFAGLLEDGNQVWFKQWTHPDTVLVKGLSWVNASSSANLLAIGLQSPSGSGDAYQLEATAASTGYRSLWHAVSPGIGIYVVNWGPEPCYIWLSGTWLPGGRTYEAAAALPAASSSP